MCCGKGEGGISLSMLRSSTFGSRLSYCEASIYLVFFLFDLNCEASILKSQNRETARFWTKKEEKKCKSSVPVVAHKFLWIANSKVVKFDKGQEVWGIKISGPLSWKSFYLISLCPSNILFFIVRAFEENVASKRRKWDKERSRRRRSSRKWFGGSCHRQSEREPKCTEMGCWECYHQRPNCNSTTCCSEVIFNIFM